MNTRRVDLDNKAANINHQYGTLIQVVGQNGYYSIYDRADGYAHLGAGKTKNQTYDLLCMLERGMRIVTRNHEKLHAELAEMCDKALAI